MMLLVISDDFQDLISLLLMLAGDVEANPGPVGKVDTTSLDEDDLFEIIDFLKNESAHWYKIGISLKLRPALLDKIKAEVSDCNERLTKVVTNWLKCNYNVDKFGSPTWGKLVEAVEKINAALAEKIAQKHLKPSGISEGADRLASSTSELGARKFPLLHVDVLKEMGESDRDELLTRLNEETKSLCLSFGGLVGHTEKSLQCSDVKAENLITFFQNSELEDLASSIHSSDSIPVVMSKVKKGGYWNFFNYEVLESMIRYYCEGTIKHLEEYISKFQVYCQRRVSEVPVDALEGDISSARVFKVKMDDRFMPSSSLGSIKQVQFKIQQILNRKPIVLVSVSEGCLQLYFRYFSTAVISVSEEQVASLKDIGVMSLTHTKRHSSLKFSPSSPSYAASILSTIATVSCDTNTTSGSSCSSVSLPAVKLAPNFPYLSGNKDVISQYQLKLEDETGRIKRSYTSLVVKLQHKISKIQSSETEVDPTRKEVFEKAGNFFDYESIQRLSYSYGHKARFKKYIQNFRNYCKKRVCELPSDSPEKVYGIVADKSLEALTSEELLKLEYTMNRVLGHTLLPLLRFDESGVCHVVGNSKAGSKAQELLARITSLKVSA